MKLQVTARALLDIEEIAGYLIPLSPQGARNVRAAILASFEDLLLFPRMGRLQSVALVRKISAGKYPYLIYYFVDDVAGEIVILTIQHGAREREYEDR